MSHIEVFYEGNLSTRCVHQESGCELMTNVANLAPPDLLAMSLGSCILTVMAYSAERMGVDFSGAKVEVSKEMTKTLPRRVGSLLIQFTNPVKLPEDSCLKLEKVAKDCPVHHSLNSDINIEYHFKWGVD